MWNKSVLFWISLTVVAPIIIFPDVILNILLQKERYDFLVFLLSYFCSV